MCFSATASFTSAAVLIPAGLYCLKKSSQIDQSYRAFVLLPFMFGIQQLIEAGVWVSITAGDAHATHILALGFLFFSHFLWLGWIPYSSYLAESKPGLRLSFLLIAIFGLLLGGIMYAPMLFNPDFLNVVVVKHSIDYDLKIITDEYVSQQFVTGVYMVIILIPLLLSSDTYHRIFGRLIAFSAFATWLFFDWVFLSAWCFFAALITLYIFFMIWHLGLAESSPGAVT